MKVYLFLPSSVACDQSHGLARDTAEHRACDVLPLCASRNEGGELPRAQNRAGTDLFIHP